MSSSILEKLKVKPVPKKIEQIQVKIMDPQKEETIEIKTKIIDKTKDKLINRDDFIKKLKISVSTKMPEVVPPEPIPSVKKTKKISKKLKLVSDKEDIPDVTKIRKTKKPEPQLLADNIDLQQLIGDTKIIDRLPPKEKKILLRANAYYMNNRESFINFINALFKPFKEEFQKASESLSCDRGLEKDD